MYILGFDIGGTKCAVICARWDGEKISIEKKTKIATNHSISAYEMISRLTCLADDMLTEKPDRVGISSGGPLDSERGYILSPPNLPRWDSIPVVDIMREHYGVPTYLENDANASALAEWKFGAGVGTENMIFLTFGTGLGAGLILGGHLVRGASGNAGEVGHIRMAKDGPVGFGKAGSFEGFCSGGGIARLGLLLAKEEIQQGRYPSYFPPNTPEKSVSAKSIAEAARAGDETALRVYRLSGEYLGRGLSILIDILNPEKIVIGGVFMRSGDLLIPSMQKVIEEEALVPSYQVCTVVGAKLGESIGDYAAVASALI